MNDRPHGGAYEKFPEDAGAYHNGAAEPALKALFETAITHAEDRIAWYEQKASERARAAKSIRFWSLVLFAAGTLAPIVATLLHKIFKVGSLSYVGDIPYAEIGYVLLALAGALVVFDQFFDTSGSWIRFRLTVARLEVMLADFRFAWAELLIKYGETSTERYQTAEFAVLLRNFVTKVELVAEAETSEWAQRFSQRIETFDQNPGLRVALSREDQKARQGKSLHGSKQHDGIALHQKA